MTTHSLSIGQFCDELASDPIFSELAEQFRAGLTEIDRRADKGDKNSPDFAEFFTGLEFIFSNKARSVGERLGKMAELMKLEGHPVVVDMMEFTQW
jgi:hypothetical protein